jgi:2-polyprenyl-3-methyl-5-hydroxy-6-metoxy-1,4-benzoquinol methylase
MGEEARDLSNLLKSLSDPGRVRILWLLSMAELAVHELQALLDWGQSRLSTQLGLLRDQGLLLFRREGKWSFYSLAAPDEATAEGRILREILNDWGEHKGDEDRSRLRELLEARAEQTRKKFSADTAYLGEESVPGRTWEIVARGLFQVIPTGNVLDLGAGDGILGTLAAAAGHEVTLVDLSDAQLARAKERAQREGVRVTCVNADFTNTGLPGASFDRVLVSHALHHASQPQALLREVHRLLKPGAMVWMLDLSDHEEEWMRSEQGDVWLGFDAEHLRTLLRETGFVSVRVTHPGSDPRHPRLSALCASAQKENP